jgi:hypothetical protein
MLNGIFSVYHALDVIFYGSALLFQLLDLRIQFIDLLPFGLFQKIALLSCRAAQMHYRAFGHFRF